MNLDALVKSRQSAIIIITTKNTKLNLLNIFYFFVIFMVNIRLFTNSSILRRDLIDKPQHRLLEPARLLQDLWDRFQP